MVALGKARRSLVHLHATWGGLVFVLLGLVVAYAAVRNNTPILFVLFGTMFAAVAFSAVQAREIIQGLEVQRELPQRVWQYETLYYGYLLRNQRKQPAFALNLQELDPHEIIDSSALCVHLPGKSMFRSGGRLTVLCRGRLDLSAIRLSSTFPFGLVRLHKDYWQTNSMVVWPAKGKLKADLLRRGAALTSSARPSRMQSGQDEFFGLREYRVGDNPRWIHWRRSAASEELVIREMAHPVPDTLFLILDIGRAMGDQVVEAQREKLLRFAATLIDDALGHGYQVGMTLAGKDEPIIINPGYGVGIRATLLDALADVVEPKEVTLSEVIKSSPMGPLRNAQTILITPEIKTLPQNKMSQLKIFCRNLTVLDINIIDEIFEDNELANQGISPSFFKAANGD